MIIIGAKGFAKELLEDLNSKKYNFNENNLYFFDDVSMDLPGKLFDRFRILRTFSEVESIFENESKEFVIGIGTPIYRKLLSEKFEKIGGIPITLISEFAKVGSFDNIIEDGATIMGGAQITNSIKIGKGTLVNINCTIGHDSIIGQFVEISPGVSISGHCKIGSLTSIGTGAVIIPKVTIGSNCIIGAGSVVTKDIPDNCVAVGIPAKIIKELTPLEF